MNRRAFFFAGLAVPALVRPALATANIQVVYVGGWDCPYCTVWKNQYKEAWVESPYFRQVQWIEVDVPHLREAYQERYWQGALAPIREQLPKKSGTPRFIVVRDGKVISNELGVNKWEYSLTIIRTLLA